ncbi:sensor histidine kinase [Phocaeicola sp.]
MKLIYYVIIRLSLVLTVILTGWAIFFYFAVMDEVNDEVDDSLEDYSEVIIIRALAGEELPAKNTASNNQYFLHEVTEEYAAAHEDINYKDSMVYIPEKDEKEPARILTTIFKDDNDKYFELTVSTPSIEKDDLKDAMAGWIIFLYVTLLLTIIIINVWVFYRNMRPLYVLLHWLDKYSIGKKNEPLHNDTKVSEFRKLNDAAIRYAKRSEQMFEQQKQFIGNASHEMQTPLAVCRNRLEMLMEDENLSEVQLGELMKTHQTLEHITKLNKSLLLLSKIENGQFAETSSVEVNTLLKQYLEDYKEVYEYRGITVETHEEGTFYLTMNETLAVVLLTNLLRNAFVHNVDGGHIRIVITPHGVTFCNTAAGQALDAERIFERFYQGQKKEGSTGLGLAIADTICKMQSINLRYYYKEGEHCFQIYA